MLKGYKAAWPPTSDAFSLQVAALFSRFLSKHRSCITATQWDVMTHVPSKGRHDGEHPLVAAVQRSKILRDRHETLLRIGPGVGNIRRSEGADDGFETCAKIGRRRVLVLDDTWTTGATAQSAASALAIGGATVVAIVPVGRLYAPRRNSSEELDWWDKQQRAPFDFDTCCLE